MSTPPTYIAIDHDNHHASHVGHTSDGRQFFITTPFVPTRDDTHLGREFFALFLFDSTGYVIEAKIDDLGPRETLDVAHAQYLFDMRLRELGPVVYDRIVVCPFTLERFGIRFGLIPYPPRDDGDEWLVTLEPGDYMAFYEPWDSGGYDT